MDQRIGLSVFTSTFFALAAYVFEVDIWLPNWQSWSLRFHLRPVVCNRVASRKGMRAHQSCFVTSGVGMRITWLPGCSRKLRELSESSRMRSAEENFSLRCKVLMLAMIWSRRPDVWLTTTTVRTFVDFIFGSSWISDFEKSVSSWSGVWTTVVDRLLRTIDMASELIESKSPQIRSTSLTGMDLQ